MPGIWHETGSCHEIGSCGPRGDHSPRSSSRRLCVLRLPRERQPQPQRRLQLLQEALCTAPATRKAAAAPAATTRAAAPPGGSVYCACHAKGSRGPHSDVGKNSFSIVKRQKILQYSLAPQKRILPSPRHTAKTKKTMVQYPAPHRTTKQARDASQSYLTLQKE